MKMRRKHLWKTPYRTVLSTSASQLQNRLLVPSPPRLLGMVICKPCVLQHFRDSPSKPGYTLTGHKRPIFSSKAKAFRCSATLPTACYLISESHSYWPVVKACNISPSADTQVAPAKEGGPGRKKKTRVLKVRCAN